MIKSITFTIKRPLTTVVIILVGLGFLLFSGWLITESAFEATGGEDFCGGCHTMTPMVVSFTQDVHGGNNASGFKGKCVDCHLPHNNLVNYVVAKSYFGFHDVWAQTFYNLETIDWQAKRKEREHYVFDSGCMSCHKELERASMKDSKAFVAHKPYFLGEVDKKCVSCHENVGHLNLTDHLEIK